MRDNAPNTAIDPRRYHETVPQARSAQSAQPPVCVYLETTNRCNLLCTTCPRTYEELEPPADMSWELFTSIVDQLPNVARAVLHGVGEPMLVKNLPKMVRYLKDRGVYVLFNTNGTVLNERNGRALIAAGLDELRVSLDAANAASFKKIRGLNYFNRILRNVRAFRELQKREGHDRPRVSAWLTGIKETIEELSEFVRVAAALKFVFAQEVIVLAMYLLMTSGSRGRGDGLDQSDFRLRSQSVDDRGLPRTARAGDHDQLPPGEADFDVLQVVLARSLDVDVGGPLHAEERTVADFRGASKPQAGSPRLSGSGSRLRRPHSCRRSCPFRPAPPAGRNPPSQPP